MINATFTGHIGTEVRGDIWPCVTWPESKTALGTGRSTKVIATVDGYEVRTALMPTGNGAHMLPLSKPVLKAINKELGDSVTVTILDLA